MVGQQALHRLLETLAAEPLEKRNGIPASLVRVAKPRASIPDAEAVHLLGGMIPADLSDLVSQVLQQVRQIRLSGDLHFRVRKTMICSCLRILHLPKAKQPGESFMKSSLRAVLLIIVEYWALSEHSVFVHAYTAYSLGGHFRQPNLMSFPIF